MCLSFTEAHTPNQVKNMQRSTCCVKGDLAAKKWNYFGQIAKPDARVVALKYVSPPVAGGLGSIFQTFPLN